MPSSNKQVTYFYCSYFLPFSSTHCGSYAETSAYSQSGPSLLAVAFTTAFTETLRTYVRLVYWS